MPNYPELRTFTDEQMDGISFALRHFLDSNVLSTDEQREAKTLLDRFEEGKRQPHQEGYAYIYVGEAGSKLLEDVEAALWEVEH